MTTDLKSLIRLTKAQIKPTTEMLARAFQNDPMFTYWIPNATERKNKSHFVLEAIVRFGVLYGEVYATSHNLEGVVSWVPSERADFTTWKMIRCGYLSVLLRLGRKVVSRIMSYGDYVSLMKKRHAPFRHWYLMLIGVDPSYQGRGYASALLKPMLALIDPERMPCYVDTANEKDVSIYKHFGFDVVEEGTIPKTNTIVWAMSRESAD
jgi:ribosomal protein S18 acetylase RimI-like enzyme